MGPKIGEGSYFNPNNWMQFGPHRIFGRPSKHDSKDDAMRTNFQDNGNEIRGRCLDVLCHIFQKTQAISNKNSLSFWHHFQAQFLMLFHLVCFILFRVLARETTFSLVEILQQPIKNFHFKVCKANTPNKMDHTMWKSMKNCAGKWCQKLCAFLFDATWAFGKMCLLICYCFDSNA